jgi:hypothetical protein
MQCGTNGILLRDVLHARLLHVRKHPASLQSEPARYAHRTHQRQWHGDQPHGPRANKGHSAAAILAASKPSESCRPPERGHCTRRQTDVAGNQWATAPLHSAAATQHSAL